MPTYRFRGKLVYLTKGEEREMKEYANKKIAEDIMKQINKDLKKHLIKTGKIKKPKKKK
jgi:hypothetical protein|tara:strand:+ start:298 stop:474 length:177 start_codon:yes stop_codon:yes gene_type:complete